MKLFWIGEQSEIYAGNSAEEIAEYMGDAELYEFIADGFFGEVADLSREIKDEEGQVFTLRQLLDESDSSCQLTTAYM